jgi:chromosome segregation ATPase
VTETLKKPQTSIPDLEAALRKSQQQERALAVEVGELPSKIQQAHREDAQRKAQAAREGGAGPEVAAASDLCEVPDLRQREDELPYLRWSAAIRTAALEMELNGALQDEHERKAEAVQVQILPAKEAADAATAEFERVRREYAQAERGVDVYSAYKAEAQKRLGSLEAEYPGA